MVDVTHDGDDRRTGLLCGFVGVVGVVEERLQLHLFLLTRIDEDDFGANLHREEFHLLVGERHGGGHHLALLEQEANHVDRTAVQLGGEHLRGRTSLDNDGALGYRSIARRVLRGLQCLQLLHVLATLFARLFSCTATIAAGARVGSAALRASDLSTKTRSSTACRPGAGGARSRTGTARTWRASAQAG